MFSIHRNLFLALKKVRMVKITPPQAPTARWKYSPQQNFWFHLPHSLLLFGKPCNWFSIFFFFFGLILQELCDFGFWAVNWAPKWSKIVNFGCVPFKPKWNILIDFPNTVFVLLEATSVQNFSKIKQNLVD